MFIFYFIKIVFTKEDKVIIKLLQQLQPFYGCLKENKKVNLE